MGLVVLIIAVTPWTARAEGDWAAGPLFRLSESSAGSDGTTAVDLAVDRTLVALLAPGSVLVAQAGGGGAEAAADGWQFSLTPYAWVPRATMNLAVGPVSRSTTLDVVDLVPQLHFALGAHFEATRREWTGFLDLFYLSLGQSETHQGVSTSIGFQEGFFEFGGTYHLPSVSLGGAGRLTFEPLAGGRFIWIHESLGGPNQKVTGSGSVVDPMVGGRITYHITDSVALWFRGDVAGFGISDNQTKLTYNLLGGLDWRFSLRASALVGWRYMNIDLEKRRLNLDISMNGPILAVNFYF